MIKNALQYIIGLASPTVQDIDGQTYSDKALHRINHNPKADPIRLNTLTSLVEYLKSGVDVFKNEQWFIHVQSPTLVQVFSSLDSDRVRETICFADAQIPHFNFGSFIDHEQFCINLQSKFIDCEDRALLLKFAGTVESGSVAEYGDDGVSQKATVKTGISTKADALIPSPALLKPYRTFVEVEQPSSSFIFRMKQGGCNGIQCALFEADGGAWKNVARHNIKQYLSEALAEHPNFIIIS